MTAVISTKGIFMTSLFATASDSSGGGAALVVLLILFAAWILVIIGWWKVFEKAGEAGWKAIIPIWNTIVLLRIAGRPLWWIVLLLIPIVNIVILIIVMNDLARSFGKSSLFVLGLVIFNPIFMMILGFGSATYRGPAAVGGNYPDLTTPPPPPPPAATA